LRNFLKIAEGQDTLPLLLALSAQPELWNKYKVRTTQEGPLSVHKSVDDIVLRYAPYTKGEDFMDKICSTISCVDYPAWHKLPQAHPFIFGVMARVQGVHLGRVMISRVPPGGSIPPHSDRIGPAEELFPDRVPPALYYERYHVVLQSGAGVIFRADKEEVYMAAGEVWWFDNQTIHSVENNSASDRLHLVMDIRTKHDDYLPQ
jgi:hypothetical protein